MNTHRITDDEAPALLRGRVPADREDLTALAEAVAEMRQAAFQAPPRPSAELALRLDLERAERISPSLPATTPATALTPASSPRTRRRRVAFTGLASLGLATKIAIGAGAALAVGVGGAGAAGAVGALPGPAQQVFEQVTGHPGGEHVSDTGVENSEFGIETAENAGKPADDERQTGLENAEDANQNGMETAGENASEQGQEGLDTAVEQREAGLENAEQATQGAGDTADDKGATGQQSSGDAPGSGKH
ncbi:hypothetical protein ACWEOH_08655 [Agromyces sp. NPDC004153]